MALLTPSLEDQIRARWGNNPAWQNDSVDLVGDLAKLLRARGITDLDKLEINAGTQDRVVPGYRYASSESEDTYVPERTERDLNFTLGYDGKPLDRAFLGNIDTGGGISDGLAQPVHNPDMLAWNSNGKGSHTYKVVLGADGKPTVVPEFNSSSFWNDDMGGLVKAIAMAAASYAAAAGAGGGAGAGSGGATAGGSTAAAADVAAATQAASAAGMTQAEVVQLLAANGMTDAQIAATIGATDLTAGTSWGAVASAGNKAGMTNAGMTAARGGDLGDIGRAYGAGFVSGGAGNFGGQMGWSPVATSAGVSGGMTLANGGTIEDAARSAGGSAFNTYLNTNGLTGNATADRVIGRVGSGVIRTGEVDGRAVAGGVVDGLLAQGNNKQSSVGGDEGGDAFDEAAVQGGSGGGDMADETDDYDFSYDSYSGGFKYSGGGNAFDTFSFGGGGGDDPATVAMINGLLTSDNVDFSGGGYTDPLGGDKGGSAVDRSGNNSFDPGKLPDWLKGIGSMLGLNSNDAWKALFGGLATAYTVNKTDDRNAANNQFTLDRDKSQNQFTLDRDKNNQTFVTSRDAVQNQFTLDRDKNNQDFITGTNQTKRNWTIEDRDELRKWNEQQQQAEWDRMLPVSYRPMELKVIPGTKAAAGTMAGNNGYASTIDVVGDLSYATDPNRKRGLLG